MTDSIANQLTANWIWVPSWVDSDPTGSAGRLVTFLRRFSLSESLPTSCLIHLSADTRYKLLVNGVRVTFGPARSEPRLWFYDTVDIGPYLRQGENDIKVIVMRWFKAGRAAHPFVRADQPGFTMVGMVGEVDLGTGTRGGWTAVEDKKTVFPVGLVDDVFLHINERVSDSQVAGDGEEVVPEPYNLRCVNGELAPWDLYPRTIPLPEQTSVNFIAVHNSSTDVDWSPLVAASTASLSAGRHTCDLMARVHSTAFLRFTFNGHANVKLRIIYSESYEDEPRQYPWLRTKSDRKDPSKQLHGPSDVVKINVDGRAEYEPFWFRTFRVLRLEMECDGEVQMGIEATQTNYPMGEQGKWKDDTKYGEQIWDVSIRTMRNCMVDGYSDCPFYEQLMYSGDSRSVGLFHYLISGDDRLGRHAVRLFTSSAISLPGGTLTQSRYPSHIPQIIAGFPLYYIMSIYDHYLYFGDRSFVLPLLPTVYGILQWYDSHIDELGLVSGISDTVWQYVDWVTTWSATDEHPDKGVPTAGRRSNRHTFFSLLYSYALSHVVQLLEWVGRPGMAVEYRQSRDRINKAVREHCFDEASGLFTDSTIDQSLSHELPHLSQHCQVFAILCGAATDMDPAALLTKAFTMPQDEISKCSYVMLFYAFRAMSQVGIYDTFYPKIIKNWHRMIDNNMTTWEEDDVRQRSDCHAWGSVPIYEFATEIAGLKAVEPGCSKVRWAPRVYMGKLDAVVHLGNNRASVSWNLGSGEGRATAVFDKAVKLEVWIQGKWVDCGTCERYDMDVSRVEA